MPSLILGPSVRVLTAEDLDVGFTATAATGRAASAPDAPEIDPNDPDAQEIQDLLSRYSGVLLTGAPGTSKTYVARLTAAIMTDGDEERQAFTQFHSSYQYEDFMEGYRPRDDGGFERRLGIFLDLCHHAATNSGDHVMVIDELSRGDAARIFGEALTYIERTKRGIEFKVPSGVSESIPPNVHVIATMNPLDRGVDEVDAAFERRFAKKVMPPNTDLLDARLTENGLPDDLRQALLAWFKDINGQGPIAQIGHAYFWDVADEASLREVWECQVQFHVERAFKYEDQTRDRLRAKWSDMFATDLDSQQPA